MENLDINKFALKFFYNEIISEIKPFTVHRNEFRLPFLHTITSSLKHIKSTSQLYAAGGSTSSQKTMVSAIGESIERTCLNIPPKHLLRSSYDELAEKAVNPSLLYGYADEVYTKLNIVKYYPKDETVWYKCKNVVTQEMKYVPACNIWKNVDYIYSETAIWDKPVSTGASAHYSPNQALLSGILEVIERDAFALHWENNISGLHVELPQKVKHLQDHLQQKKLIAEIVKLPNEFGIPVACCNITDSTKNGPFSAFGAAAKLTWEEAAFRALEEAMLTTVWLSVRMREKYQSYESLLSLLSGIPDPVVHADIYAAYNSNEQYEFLFNEKNLYQPASNKDHSPIDLKQLIKCIIKKGYEIYVADITKSEFREMGYVVYRVIIPGLLPLSRGFYLRHSLNLRHSKMLNDCVIRDSSKQPYYVHPLP